MSATEEWHETSEKSTQTSPGPPPTYRKTKKLHCSLVLTTAARQMCPPIAHPSSINFCLLGTFSSTVNKLSCPAAAWASPSLFHGAHGPGMRQGRQGWSPAQLPPPAHGGHRSLQYRLEHSPFLNSQGPELSWRGWRLFHIFSHTTMIKPSHFCLLLSLA